MASISIRTQYHFRQSGKGLLAWDVRRLIKASKNLPIVEVPLSAIEEIDQQYWYDLGGAVPTCRNIAEHAELIHKEDLGFSILLDCDSKVFDR